MSGKRNVPVCIGYELANALYMMPVGQVDIVVVVVDIVVTVLK